MKKQIIKSKHSILKGSTTQKVNSVSVQSIKSFEPAIPKLSEEDRMEQEAAKSFDLNELKTEYVQKEMELKQALDTELIRHKEKRMAEMESEFQTMRQSFENQLAEERSVTLDTAKKSGLTEAQEEIESQYATLLTDLTTEINALSEKRSHDFNMDKATILELSLAIAEKIVQQALSDNPDQFLTIVDQALSKITDKDKVIIQVAKPHFEWVNQHLDVIKKKMPDIRSLDVEIEDRLLEGGCIIETNLGYVDSSVSTKIDMIKKAFFDILENETAATSTGDASPSSIPEKSVDDAPSEQNSGLDVTGISNDESLSIEQSPTLPEPEERDMDVDDADEDETSDDFDDFDDFDDLDAFDDED